ncbi:hypothetical protein Dimus_002104 [Dionaea muscipula]
MAEQVSSHLEPWQSLEGKVVMITGASSGIGREFCLDLARAGCRIVAAARRTDRLKSLCDQINQFSSSSDGDSAVRSVAVELDVCADGQSIESSVQMAWDAFGRIDALINNAGVRGNIKSPLDLCEDEWNSTVNTNLRGAWLVSKYICARMRDAKVEGSVINMSSIAGLHRGHLPGGLAYSVSKAAMDIMTKVMALELGAYKIRVNSIAPGLFRSEITEKLMHKDWLSKVTFKINPLRELGSIDPALTSLVRYLIHESSGYVTGNIFIVDAGATLQVMALELGGYKIRVNSIASGIFRSEITEKLMHKDWLTKVTFKINPLRDLGSIDPALTSMVRYLIHESSGYVTGNIFIADAGQVPHCQVSLFSLLSRSVYQISFVYEILS